MIGPVPVKLADFFGNLSVSTSPFGWSSWFVFFATLVFRDDRANFFVFFVLTGVVIAALIVKAATDKVPSDDKMLKQEFRFIAGSGIGATMLGMAAVYGVDHSSRYPGVVIWMGVAMLVFFFYVVSVKKYVRDKIFNFSQAYLLLASSFTGFAVNFLRQAPTSRDAMCVQCSQNLATLYFFCWAIIFLVMIAYVFSLNSEPEDNDV